MAKLASKRKQEIHITREYRKLSPDLVGGAGSNLAMPSLVL